MWIAENQVSYIHLYFVVFLTDSVVEYFDLATHILVVTFEEILTIAIVGSTIAIVVILLTI